MKFFTGLILVLLLQVRSYAHMGLPKSIPKDSTVLIQKTVDRFNATAFKIYLESPDSARITAGKALFLSSKINYPTGIGVSFLNIGRVYWSQSYYTMALFCMNKALLILPKDQHLIISACYNITGRIYADLGNYKAALKSLEQSIYYADNKPGPLAEAISERSYVYMRLKSYSQAIADAHQAMALNRQVNNYANIAVLYGRLSGIYNKKHDYKAAIAYADTAYKLSFQTRNKRLRANTYIEYARVHNQLHDRAKAILYASKGAALADSIGVVDALLASYKELVATYEQENDMVNALAYQKKYNRIQDSLNTFNKVHNTKLIQDYFALDKRLSDLADMERNALETKHKLKWQRVTIITLGVSLIVVLAILWAIFYFYRQKKKLSDQLNERNEALQQQKQLIEMQKIKLEMNSKIKDKLLAVIGHDLRTPLAGLRNIADMFDADYLSTDEVQWLMKDISPLVKSAEITLSNLMEWAVSQIKGQSMNSSRLDVFLLGVEMEQVFNHALQKKSIEFVNMASPGQSVTADENHIKVVLRNLISNAIKFTDSKGCITLDARFEDNKVIISVEDNGKGMSPEEMSMLFFVPTHFSQPGTMGEHGTGIGLLLCKELVELNGGKLWINSSPGKGSKFYFSIPLQTTYV